MLNRSLIEEIAGALATDEGLVEKDWHVIRALGIIATLLFFLMSRKDC